MIGESMIVGSAVADSKFEAAAAKLPPEARAKIRAALDTPRARAFGAFRAQAAKWQASQRAKIDRAPLECAKAEAAMRARDTGRASGEESLTATLRKSHAILARLNAPRRE